MSCPRAAAGGRPAPIWASIAITVAPSLPTISIRNVWPRFVSAQPSRKLAAISTLSAVGKPAAKCGSTAPPWMKIFPLAASARSASIRNSCRIDRHGRDSRMTRRIVVLGGGFAGVSAAQELAKQLRKQHRLMGAARRRRFRRGSVPPPPDRNAIEVLLLNRDNYFVFQPL